MRKMCLNKLNESFYIVTFECLYFFNKIPRLNFKITQMITHGMMELGLKTKLNITNMLNK